MATWREYIDELDYEDYEDVVMDCLSQLVEDDDDWEWDKFVSAVEDKYDVDEDRVWDQIWSCQQAVQECEAERRAEREAMDWGQ